ncbi:MFS transporter [Nocardia gipuzkoensis]
MCAAVGIGRPEMIRPGIWTITAAKGISTLGNIAFSTGVVWIFVHEYGDARTAGLMLAVSGIVAIVLAPGVGALLDRERGILLVLVADYSAFAIVLAVVLVGASHSPAGLWVAMLATSVGGTAYGPGLQMLISRLVPNEQRRNANAKVHSAVRIALIGGPLAGGAIVSISGRVGLLVFDAATFLVSGVLITLICCAVRSQENMNKKSAGSSSSFIDSVRFMFENKVVRWVLILGASVNMLTSVLAILLPVLAQRISHSGITYGVMYSVYQCGMLSVAIALSNERTSRFSDGGESKVVACALALFAAGFLGAISSDSIWVLGISVFVIGAGLSATSLFADTRLLTSVPLEMQGRVFSLSGSILASLRPAGNAVGGLLVGISTVLVGVIAAVTAAGCAVAMAVGKPLDTPEEVRR